MVQTVSYAGIIYKIKHFYWNYKRITRKLLRTDNETKENDSYYLVVSSFFCTFATLISDIMAKKYNTQENEPQMAKEPTVAYGYSATPQHAPFSAVLEGPNSKKKEFLRVHLHASTVEILESVEWMEDKPFPIYSDDEDWIDAAEAEQGADIVDDAIILKDRLAWQSLR